MLRTLLARILERLIETKSLLKNGILYLFGFGPIMVFSLFLKFNKDKCNPIIVNIPVAVLLVIFSITNFLIFFISVDTGRYFHLAYTNVFIFIFGLIYKNHLYKL